MKKVFAALAALATLAMMAAVVSCEYDSPDIRFQQTTTITNDYSEVVKALQDQTLALSKKNGTHGGRHEEPDNDHL